MKKKLASEETINRIYNSIGANTELLFLSLCTCVDSIKQLKVCVSKNSADYRTELLLTMLEIKAFVITIQLNIATFLRADFRAQRSSLYHISGWRYSKLLRKMFPQCTGVSEPHSLRNFLNGIPILHDQRSRLANPYTPYYIHYS